MYQEQALQNAILDILPDDSDALIMIKQNINSFKMDIKINSIHDIFKYIDDFRPLETFYKQKKFFNDEQIKIFYKMCYDIDKSSVICKHLIIKILNIFDYMIGFHEPTRKMITSIVDGPCYSFNIVGVKLVKIINSHWKKYAPRKVHFGQPVPYSSF